MTAPPDVSADLGGRGFVVTGSTRGIGRALAEHLIRRGARVAINGRNHDEVERVVAEIGEGATGVAADITEEAGANELIERAAARLDRLDGLVNNAGIAQVDPTVELSAERWSQVLALNLTAPFLCSREAARLMLDSGGGAIVNVLSIAGLTGLPGRAAYSATKAGLLGLSRTLALEWGPAIRVNSVAPGYVRTDLLEELAADGKVDLEAIVDRVPARRLAEAGDVVGVIGFLLSDTASYITGETIVVDGGWLANGSV